MHLPRRTLLLSPWLAAGCQRSPPPQGAAPGPLDPGEPGQALLRDTVARLSPLQQVRPAPRGSDWMAAHHEPKQSLTSYLRRGAVLPSAQRSTLVILPLGELSAAHERVLTEVVAYLQAFFGLPTRCEPRLLLTPPADARRDSRGFGEQWLTAHLLDRVLAPRLPPDAMAYLAFTASDLWPGEGWNFVFGEASLRARTGVWSLARNGDPSNERQAPLALLRALKTASHETAHMFGLEHCSTYLCTMAGANSLDESDRYPTWLCPECLCKLSWATRLTPASHLTRMRAYAEAHAMPEESAFYQQSLRALGPPPG